MILLERKTRFNVVHGDRLEAFGSTSGIFNNILVAHMRG